MNWVYYNQRLNKDTIDRCDVSSLFQDYAVFHNLVNDLIRLFDKIKFDKIVAVDALGFVLGGAISMKTKKPLFLARKGGKLPLKPENLLKISFVDYTKNSKSFEIEKDAICKGDKVLIVDEWIETGAQIKAVIRLIEQSGGKIVGVSTINIDKNADTEPLFKKYDIYPIHISR